MDCCEDMDLGDCNDEDMAASSMLWGNRVLANIMTYNVPSS